MNNLPNVITLNRNGDFRRMYARGKSYANPVLVTYVMKNRAGVCRIGITASKKIGNAVERNRARRVIRAAYANILPKINGAWDIVFVARGRTGKCKSSHIERTMEKHLVAAGLINKDAQSKNKEIGV